MATLRITLDAGRPAVLSTDHATSSYGLPVLLVDGAPIRRVARAPRRDAHPPARSSTRRAG
jgi:hypothetical protein